MGKELQGVLQDAGRCFQLWLSRTRAQAPGTVLFSIRSSVLSKLCGHAPNTPERLYHLRIPRQPE